MKNTKTNLAVNRRLIAGIIAIVAIIGFSFAACDTGGDDTPSINTTALNDVILEAGLARDGVETANSASEVPTGKKWVTESEGTAFDTAYKTAVETKAKPSSQSAVDTAKTNLQAALVTFNAAKKNGSGSAIKLSGTITVKNKGQLVPYVVISAHTSDWSWSEETKVHIKDESTQWEIITTPFPIPTEISFNISSYDNDKYEKLLFETTVDGLKKQVFNVDVDNIAINETLNLITISGTLKLGNNVQTIPSIVIQAFKKGDNDNIIGNVKLINAVNNIPWSIMIPPQAADTGITFSVVGFEGPLPWEYDRLFEFWQHDFGVKVGSQNKPGIVLNFITISGTLNLDYNGQTIPSVFISMSRKDNTDIELGSVKILNAGKNTPWSIIRLPQDVDTEVLFTIVGFSVPKMPSEWWESRNHLFALWNKDFGVIKVGNQSKSGIALNLITISGTVNATYKGNPVPSVYINIDKKVGEGEDDWEWIAGTELHSPAANAPWSIVIPAFTSDTEISINSSGNDANDEQLFWKATTRTVKNTNVSGIALNFIELSGTVSVTFKGNRVPIVEVNFGTDDSEWLGTTELPNPSANAPWFKVIPAFTSDTVVHIGVIIRAANGDELSEPKWWVENITVKDTNVSGIALNLGNITE